VYSVFIRMELSYPHEYIMFGDMYVYNVMITAHGIFMIFFTVMPALIGGMGNIFLPLLCGVPEMAFPRLNNLSF